MYARIDTLDPDCLTPYLAPDGVVTFGNQPPMRGIDEVREGCRGFFSTIAGLSHELVGVWTCDNVTTVQQRVTYTRHDGKDVTVPALSLMVADDGGLISEYSVYFDLAPVFA